MRSTSEIAELVRDRRKSLRLSQRAAATAANVSSTTWQSFEKHHHPVSELTVVGMARALSWPDDWYDRLAAGADPDELAAAGHSDETDVVDITGLSQADKDAILAIVERFKTRR